MEHKQVRNGFFCFSGFCLLGNLDAVYKFHLCHNLMQMWVDCLCVGSRIGKVEICIKNFNIILFSLRLNDIVLQLFKTYLV